MPAPLSDVKELARQAYYRLPLNQRSATNILKALADVGVDPLPTAPTINRWKKTFVAVVEQTAEVLLPACSVTYQLSGGLPPMPGDDDLADVPEALREVLSPRLLQVAKGKGLDRVEDAVALLADAIGSRAGDIAQMLLDTESETTEVTGGEGAAQSTKTVKKAQVARSAVAALAQLGSTMQSVTAARTMVSLAHRNFSEGDHLYAQARAIIEGGRAEGAKVINGDARREPERSAAEDAMTALRGTVAKPK